MEPKPDGPAFRHRPENATQQNSAIRFAERRIPLKSVNDSVKMQEEKAVPEGNPPDRILVAIDRDMENLIPEYLENRLKDIEAIRVALAQENYCEIQPTGHKMKVSGGGYGFNAATDIGRILEQAAKDQNAEMIADAVANLHQYLQNFEIVYE
jgi:HPt (histidine-containing phosphotransfer) domain-containing protein